MPLADTRSRLPAGSVFTAFLRLGLTAFGGPIAHLGYFHREFVVRRRWIDETQYAQLLALCQFLPGPASSQFGFALGLIRSGWAGAVAAFVAFTLPSALLLFAFAAASRCLAGPWGDAAVHGLKLVAVAVVAEGVRRMAIALTPDVPRALLAAGSALAMLAADLPMMQLAVIAVGALLGPWAARGVTAHPGAPFPLHYSRRTGSLLLGVFAGLLVATWIVPALEAMPLATVAAAFYRAGALVFGGGHVVLPLLEEAVVDPGWVDIDTFIAGYGAAQAIPGPLFSIAAFLGAKLAGGQGAVLGALVSLLSIFLPGLLLVAGALPWWKTIGQRPGVTRAMAGVNAAVVGLLAAALYDPVWTSAVTGAWDVVIAGTAFMVLASMRVSTLWIVVACVAAAVAKVALFG